MKTVTAIIAVSITGLVSSGCSQPTPIPSGADTKFYGNISEGGKFGVSIGTTRKVSRAAMEAKAFEFSGTTTCGESGLREEIACDPDDVFDFYHKHRTLGHDTVFIRVYDDRVMTIGWSFNLLHVDF